MYFSSKYLVAEISFDPNIYNFFMCSLYIIFEVKN